MTPGDMRPGRKEGSKTSKIVRQTCAGVAHTPPSIENHDTGVLHSATRKCAQP